METQRQNFIELINNKQGIIRSLCKAYYVSYEDQRDAFQDIILQLWKSFDTFRGTSELSTWIYSVSLHTILSNVRKEKRRVVTEPLTNTDYHMHVTMADDDKELLQMVIHSLKDVDKAIVILFLEGYGNKEIAHILNITPTNVSTRLNRVKIELKVKLKYHQYEFRKP